MQFQKKIWLIIDVSGYQAHDWKNSRLKNDTAEFRSEPKLYIPSILHIKSWVIPFILQAYTLAYLNFVFEF